MRFVAFLPLALSAAVFAGPLTWDQLIQSAEKDPRYMAAQKRAEATSSSQGTKLWDSVTSWTVSALPSTILNCA